MLTYVVLVVNEFVGLFVCKNVQILRLIKIHKHLFFLLRELTNLTIRFRETIYVHEPHSYPSAKYVSTNITAQISSQDDPVPLCKATPDSIHAYVHSSVH